jgi:starch-binding outer membrane protein, SusD/RagB family
MKNILIKTISVSLLIVIASGCTNFVEDSNVDPDELITGNAKDYFQGILLANQFFQNSDQARTAMVWLNQANGEDRQYITLNDWNKSVSSEYDDGWNIAYANCITQAKIAEKLCDRESNKMLKGAIQVIDAHCMGTIASVWGDAPYSDMDISGNNLTPKYDSQASLYNQMQILLDDAIANLNSPGIIENGDIYYGGDKDKWIRLAYSLKARYYLHTKDYANAKANALLGISDPSGDLKAVFGNTGSLQDFNPFYSFLIVERDTYMSGDSYAYNILNPSDAIYRGNSKTDESARFAFNYTDLSADRYFKKALNIYGADYGGTSGKFGNDSDMPMVTYGEMLLIIAEVDARNSFTDGLASYNNYRAILDTGYSIGIDNSGYETETFNYAAYTASDFALGGMENASSSLTDQNALLREIMQERYIYFIGSLESFNDFGRTNNAAEIELKSGNIGTPQRFLYPQVEVNANPNTPNPIPSVTTKTPLHL